MAHRYFTQDIEGDTARLTGEEAGHLARVLRARLGQRITLCNGNGTDYEAQIASVSPQEVTLHILSSRPTQAEPSLQAQVYLGYAKGDKMEYAVQKSVELGAAAIFPFYSANTVVKPGRDDSAKITRLARIAAEAAKQSGRGILPQVGAPLQFSQVLQRAAACQQALFFYEAGGLSLRQVLHPSLRSVALIIGAEGGFTPGEAEKAAEAGCTTVGLGPRILRSETAPVAALASVMLLTGNLE